MRILIADDHEFVRRGLGRILAESHPDWQIVAQAENGLDAIEMAELLRPDLALVDLNTPGCSGLKVTESVVRTVPAFIS